MLLPKASPTQVVGLLKMLDDAGSFSDVAKIARDAALELDDILPVLETAELLGLIKVDRGDASLREEGKMFLTAGLRRRKRLIQQRLARIPDFLSVLTFLAGAPQNATDMASLREFLTTKFPGENVESILSSIVEWGRYALLLTYNSREGLIKLTPNAKKVTDSLAAKEVSDIGASMKND